jgi:hypothetical protein
MLILSLPGMGKSADETVSKQAEPAVEKVGENHYRIGEIELDAVTREIRFPAVVNQEDGALEYVLVKETGKVHESLLRTAVPAGRLQVALKLLRFRAGWGHLFDHLYPPGKAPVRDAAGEEVELLVSWADKPAIPVRRAISNRKTGKVMDDTPWVFTGSEVVDGEFQAEMEGSIVAIYRDAMAMINTVDSDSLDDEIWFPIAGVLPPRESKVQVTIRPRKREP